MSITIHRKAYCASINGLEPFVPLYRKIEMGLLQALINNTKL